MTKRRRKRRRPSIPEQMSARAVAEVLRLPVAVVNAWSASTLNRKGRARLAAARLGVDDLSARLL